MTARGAAAGTKREASSASLGSLRDSRSQDLDAEAQAAAERTARESYGKLLAFLAARSRDVPAAEDALADAFAAALAVWPTRVFPPIRRAGSRRPPGGGSSTARGGDATPSRQSRRFS